MKPCQDWVDGYRTAGNRCPECGESHSSRGLCDSCGCETDVRMRYMDEDCNVLRICPDCYADLVPTRDKDREP